MFALLLAAAAWGSSDCAAEASCEGGEGVSLLQLRKPAAPSNASMAALWRSLVRTGRKGRGESGWNGTRAAVPDATAHRPLYWEERQGVEHPAPPAPASGKAWPHPRVLYGIQTSAKPVYEAKLKAQLDTWAKGLPSEAVFAVGPGTERPTLDLWEPTGCPQNLRLCKAEFILDRAHNRSDYDWLVIAFEDFYFDTGKFASLLGTTDEPVVRSVSGCGRLWKNDPRSQGGTLPRPKGWVEPASGDYSCPHVEQQGGMCGGFGMYFSRAAVEKLYAHGGAAVRQYLASLNSNIQVDVSMSCLLYEKGIKIEQVPPSMKLVTVRDYNTTHPTDKLGTAFHVVGGWEVPDYIHRIHQERGLA